MGCSGPDANNGAQCTTPQKNASFQARATPAPRHSSTGKSLKNRKQTPFKSDSHHCVDSSSPKLSRAFATNKVVGSGTDAFGAATQNENNNPNGGANINTTFTFRSSGAPAFCFPNNKTNGMSYDGTFNDHTKNVKSAPFAFDDATSNDTSCSTPLKSAEASSNPFSKQGKSDAGTKFAKGTPKVETVEDNATNAPKMGSSNPFTGHATPMFGSAQPASNTETKFDDRATAPKTTVRSKPVSPIPKEGGTQSKMPHYVDDKNGQSGSFKAPASAPVMAAEKKGTASNGTGGGAEAKRNIDASTGTGGGAKAKRSIDAASSGADDKATSDLISARTDVEDSLITWKILSYKDCSVEDILTMIRDELQVDAATYFAEAKKVLGNEIAIRMMEQDLIRASAALQKTMAKQEDLFQTFATIEAFQMEMDSTLEVLEKQVDQMFQAHASQPPTHSDYDRELIFQLAQETASIMDQMENDAKAAEASMAHLCSCGEEDCLHSVVYSNDKKLDDLEVRGLLLKSSIEELERTGIFN